MSELDVIYDQSQAFSLEPSFPVSPVKSIIKKKRAAEVDEGAAISVIHLFSFPSPRELAGAAEADLREMGMGYRAKFIVGTVKFILERETKQVAGAADWLTQLRGGDRSPVAETSRRAVRQALLQLPGVGPKVADCVALFSLDQSSIIPVDTHVWSIAIRDYAPELKASKSLTPSVYEAVGEAFRQRFQVHAGWAHSVLFAAELPAFRGALPVEMVSEMKGFSDLIKQEKSIVKEAKKQRSAPSVQVET
jgi:N-glycosylase/DNA lyase